MKGILLSGGTGSRLWPSTLAISKQLVPVFDKPMIYYPLSTLMLAGIREVLIITNPDEEHLFKKLFGDGSKIGMRIEYKTQEHPDGIASAFLIGQDFLSGESCCLILGDNIFYGVGLGLSLSESTTVRGAKIFGYPVSNPNDYGIAEVNEIGNVIGIDEKPENPKSNLAIPGIYFVDGSASRKASEIEVSSRGEREITELLSMYMLEDSLELRIMPRGTAWLDCGSTQSLNDASTFIRVIEERQGFKIGCIEEIAWRQGWISHDELKKIGLQNLNSDYGKYLVSLGGNS